MELVVLCREQPLRGLALLRLWRLGVGVGVGVGLELACSLPPQATITTISTTTRRAADHDVARARVCLDVLELLHHHLGAW